jgi:hypothetical protein
MAAAGFEHLCAGFCELVQLPTPALKADDRGLIAFHVVLRGATVNLVHRPAVSPDHVFVLFELGPIGHDGSDSVSQLVALLEANFVLLELNAPVFSRNPATGDAILQYVYPLFEATPNDLYELIDKEIDRISHWRESLATSDPGIGGQITAEIPPPSMLHQIA